MQGVKGFPGGEAAESGRRRKPTRRFRAESGRLRDRLERRNAALAMLAGILPFNPLGRDDLADAFGLSRSQTSAILATYRDAVAGGGDA